MLFNTKLANFLLLFYCVELGSGSDGEKNMDPDPEDEDERKSLER